MLKDYKTGIVTFQNTVLGVSLSVCSIYTCQVADNVIYCQNHLHNSKGMLYLSRVYALLQSEVSECISYQDFKVSA